MEDWQTGLRREFDAEGAVFLLEIRCELTWDVDRFDRLTGLMESCCRAKEDSELVERWLANGFWFLSWFVKEWTTHPNFPRWRTEEYYEVAYEYLNGLAFWFFFGEAPWTDEGAQIKAKLEHLKGLEATNHNVS